jgi:hypothetical protein
MRDDKQDQVNQQNQGSQNGNAHISGELGGNDVGHQTTEQCKGSNELPAEASGRPTVSSRKIAANQRNAVKSTGPRTPAGKKIVARNALTHGFFSKWLLVQHRDGKESQDEYDRLEGALRKHYQPMDWLEELWVERIAVWSWRLRRLIRYESGQIARALAGHSFDLQQSKAEDLGQPESTASSNLEMDAMTDHLFLPANDDLDKLLRYEAMINKQLNHAISELERLQARRKEGSTGPMFSNIAKQSQEPL